MNKKEAIESDNKIISNLAYHDIYIKPTTMKIIETYMINPNADVVEVCRNTGISSISVYGAVLRLGKMGIVKLTKKGRYYDRVDVDPENKFGLWD